MDIEMELHIRGTSLDFEAVTRRLELTPSRTVFKPEAVDSDSGVGIWAYTVRGESESISEFIKTALARLNSKRDAIVEIASDHTVYGCFIFGIFTELQFCKYTIDPDALAELNSYGLPISFGIYMG